jgi:hypothetical protein
LKQVFCEGLTESDMPVYRAIINHLRRRGMVAVIVLGGGHDLSKQVGQLGGGQCEYVKVMPENWPNEDGDEVAQDE